VANGDERREIAEAARARREELSVAGVAGIALTFVDNAGVTRVKAIPTAQLEHAVVHGVGMSTVHDVFQVDDSITTSRYIGGPVGDLRLRPDLDALTVLHAQPGWAWAPVDRWTKDGRPYRPDQRTFARRMVRAARDAGVTPRMGFEIEWYLAHPDGSPATLGPAYGMTRLMEVGDYARDVLVALAAEGVPVEQFHPEYAASQFEVSTGPADPVTAADRVVLTRETIRAVSRGHGFRASFAPIPVADSVGNGMHVHLSLPAGGRADDGRNVFAGGTGPAGLTERGASVIAELLARLPAISAITGPSVGSRMRAVPQRWAGTYQCWGVENREAGLRFVPAADGADQRAANVELKCVDGSANPYLVVGAVCAVVVDGLAGTRRLPAGLDVDPATLPPDRRPPRLPETVEVALDALAADTGLLEALGPELVDAFRSVQLADAAWAEGQSAEDVVAAVRWRY
jgi:glutamine synthetase